MSSRRVRNVVVFTLSFSVAMIGCETGVPTTEAAELYYNLGNAYFELDKHDQAVSAYLNALALDGRLPQAGYNLARVYIESGKPDQGLEVLNNLLEDDPGNSVILSTIGWAYYLMSDYEGAYEVFLDILERTPTDRNGLHNAAVLAWKLDRKQEALSLFERLYDENEDSETLYRIASVQMDLELWPEAIDTLNVYVARKPDDDEAFYDLGIAYTADRLYGEALGAFDSAIEINTHDPDLYFEKAVVLLLYIENLEEGIITLELAVERGFDDSDRAEALVLADELRFVEEVREFFLRRNLISEKSVEGEASPGETPPPDDAEESSLGEGGPPTGAGDSAE